MILESLSRADVVLILGFAREGQSTYRYLRSRFPHLQYILADQKQPDWVPTENIAGTLFGSDYLYSLGFENCKLIIKSPGISPHKPEIEAAVKTGKVFSSHTEIFFDACPSEKVIGISGTKGKSTTASIIYHVLHATGQPAVFVGNIGQPALDFLAEITPDTWVVMELSSYQLMSLSRSPHIAVLQNLYPDHLDYHLDYREYLEAKANLFRHQHPNDHLIFNADNSDCQKLVSGFAVRGVEQHPYHLSDFDPGFKTRLLGDHNRLNILPSLIIADILHLPLVPVTQAVADFAPLDTRLQSVGSVNGVEFYEDTLATIPEATIAAIDALHPRVETLIAGGHDRKQNYLELAKKILSSNIKALILFPSTGSRIQQEVASEAARTGRPAPAFYNTESMSEAVTLALDHTASGAICLLSPAAPSFTLFKDYRDEAAQYRQAIQNLPQKSD